MAKRFLFALLAFGLLVAACGDDDDAGDAGADATAEGSASGGGSSSDPKVKEAQELLAGLGCNPGSADGVAGASTKSAVEAFQRALSLDVDGEIDDALLGELRDADGRVCGDDDGGSSDDDDQSHSDEDLDGYTQVVVGQFSTQVASSCPDAPSASEVIATVEFGNTSGVVLEGFVDWEGRGTVTFDYDTTDNTVTFKQDVCVGIGE